MGANKLNGYRALRIIPSDNADIPYPAITTSGNNTSATSGKLVNSGATFQTSGVQIGDIVYNVTDQTTTFVTNVDSETVLSLNNNIFAAGSKAYVIYGGGQNTGCVLYVGGTGDINCVTEGGDTVLFKNVAVGIFGGTCPIQVKKVLSTSTTATLINSIW